MAKHLIDLTSTARYAGVDTDIIKYADGNAATAAVFNAPPQNLRQRVETLRQEVEDLKYVADADRAMVLAIQGTLTATEDDGFYLSLTAGGYLLVRPFISRAGALGSGILAVGGSQVIQLTVADETTAPKAWGQYDGGWGPATRGANAIVVTFRRKTTPGITITTDGADYKLLVGVPDGTTVNTLVTALSTDALMGDLYLSATVLGGLGSTPITLTTGTDLAVPIEGAADAEAHKITKAVLDAFFAFSTNYLQDGDTLAIWYDQLVDAENGEGGRRQQLVGSTLNSEMLFNTRINPEKIPGCIPVATVVGTKLFLIDGTVMTDGESIGGSGTEYLPTAGGTVSGNLIVQGSTTLGDGSADPTRVNGTFGVGELGDTAGEEPFRVTKDGAVTAASVAASGAITGASLDVSGALEAGSSGQFQVSSAGAVTAPSISNGVTDFAVGNVNYSTNVQGSLDVGKGITAGTNNVFEVTLAGALSTPTVNATTSLTSPAAVFTSTLGVGGTDYAGSEFKVDNNGHVTTPAISNGNAALSVGTAGYITTVAGRLDVAGETVLGSGDGADCAIVRGSGTNNTLAVGDVDDTRDNAPFRVTALGAVTAASVNAGIGAVQTTGAVSGGTVTATTSVTTPAIANGSANMNVGTASYTTAVLGHETVAGNLDVAGTLKAGTDDAFQVAANGSVTVGISGSNGGVTVYNGDASAAFTVKKSDTVTTASLSGDGALVLGDTDAVPAGSLTLYNGTTNVAAIEIKSGDGYNIFKVDGDASMTLGQSGVTANNGEFVVYNNTNNSTNVITVSDGTTDKFLVTSSGAVTASAATIGSYPVNAPYSKEYAVSAPPDNIADVTVGLTTGYASLLTGGQWTAVGAAAADATLQPGTYLVIFTMSARFANSQTVFVEVTFNGTEVSRAIQYYPTGDPTYNMATNTLLTVTSAQSLGVRGMLDGGSGNLNIKSMKLLALRIL